MNTLIPGAPLRSLSPTTNEYQRAQGESRAAKPARAARFTLDAPEHSGTIPGARGDILTPGVALTSNLAVIFTLNQHTPILPYAASLHAELHHFVNAGLSPFEALQSATVHAAEALGVADDLGSIETGKLADLVVVEGNPLQNIHDARAVRVVIANGKVYELENLLKRP